MTNQMTSDTSFWLKFLHDIDLSIDNNTLLRYSTILANRFATIEELLAIDETDLINIGITNQFDRACLIKQAHLLDDKENLPLIRQSAASNGILGNWLGNTQSTPLNPKSKCILSPALLSRISFNDNSTSDESVNINKKCHFEHIIETPERIITIDDDERIKTLIQSCQKKTPPTSARGMRAIKSLSDTISLQKKILIGTDRLKRLALTKSLFKRQAALITKKVSNITNKIINPFTKVKNKNDSITINNIKITPSQITIENSTKQIQEIEERRKIQVLSLNNDIRCSTDFISHQNLDEIKHIVQPVQTLTNKRFKLGAPTAFLTRSLANHGHLE